MRKRSLIFEFVNFISFIIDIQWEDRKKLLNEEKWDQVLCVWIMLESRYPTTY